MEKLQEIKQSGTNRCDVLKYEKHTTSQPISMNDTFYPPKGSLDYVPRDVEIFAIVMLLIVSVAGTSGNLLTILAVITQKALRKMSNVYILNLAIVDLIVSLFLTPVSVHTMLNRVEPIGCQTILPFISMLCTAVSVLNLSAIAVNRYIAIMKGKKIYRKHYTKVKVGLSIIFIWVLGTLVSIPPLLGFGKFGYDIKFGICFIPPNNVLNYWYTFCVCVVFAFPFVITTVFAYTKIIRKFYKVQSNMRRHSISGIRTMVNTGTYHQRRTCSMDALNDLTDKMPIGKIQVNGGIQSPIHNRIHSGPTNPDLLAQKLHKQQLQMFKVAFNCIVVWIFFLIVWMPVLSLHIFDYGRLVPAQYYRVLFAIAYTNFAVNAFIYAGLNPNFRTGYKTLLCCNLWGGEKETPRSSSFKTEYCSVPQPDHPYIHSDNNGRKSVEL